MNDPDDPGWNSVASGGRNYTYIGDGWVLGALHVGVTTAAFYLQNYAPIANQDYIVHNPTDWSVPLTTNADLVLFRIDGDPGLPNVTIAFGLLRWMQKLCSSDGVMAARLRSITGTWTKATRIIGSGPQ